MKKKKQVKTESIEERRMKELLKDKWQTQLLYLIGKENGLSTSTVDKDKRKKYFKEMILEYLNDEE